MARSRAHSDQRGLAAIWLLVAIALLIVASVSILRETRDLSSSGVRLLAMACLAVVGSGIVAEALLDFFRCCRVVVLIAFVGAVFAGGFHFRGDGGFPFAAPALLVCVPVFLVAGAYVFVVQSRPSKATNHLRRLVHDQQIAECKGVQFALVAPDAVVAGSVVRLQIAVQNCFDARREVVVRLASEDTLFDRMDQRLDPREAPALAFPSPYAFFVEPLEYGVLEMAVWTHPSAHLRETVRANVEVLGEGGHRVLSWRSPHSTEPVPNWLSGAAMLLQLVYFGGGLTADMKVRRSKATTEPTSLDDLDAVTKWTASVSG